MRNTILICALFAAICCAQTNISGDISGILTAAGSPYHVIDDIRVPSYDSLIIEPGCSLIFQYPPYCEFLIDTGAILKARGTGSDTIVFTAADTSSGWLGMVFYSADDACSLSYCVIEYAVARVHNGGAVYLYNTPMFIGNCFFYRDSARFDGGAIYAYNGSDLGELNIQNCTFLENAAGEDGGAIHIEQATNIYSCDFLKNRAASSGGAVQISHRLVNIDDCLIKENRANSGGGVYVSFAQEGSGVRNSIIFDNFAEGNGGGIRIENEFDEIERNIIAYNQSNANGGGIAGGDIREISNNLFINNSAAISGGGMYSNDYHSHLINNTFTRNFANSAGAAYLRESIVLNCIFWDDSSNSEDTYEIYGDFPYLSHCLVDTMLCGNVTWYSGNIEGDPVFADTLCHLAYGSPCINGGASWEYFPDADTTIYPDSTDFESDIRPLNGAWDIGWDEVDTTLINIQENFQRPKALNIFSYPNPFNSAVKISVEQTFLSVQNGGQTGTSDLPLQIEIFDVNGRLIDGETVGANLVFVQSSGDHKDRPYEGQYIWRPDESLPSGVYLIRATVGKQSITKCVVYLK